jgi:hypothetical protein
VKKVIALVINTELTNKEIEEGLVELRVREVPEGSRGSTPPATVERAHHVHVLADLDSDESDESDE